MPTLDDVKTLVSEGRFHHATARTIGVPMIWVYRVAEPGDSLAFQGYTLALSIPDSPEAWGYFRSIGHGVSVGAFGSG